MYTIDKHNNRITRLEERSFSQLGFREREHLQEWIANDPACLGEELLIIQKEFDGFQDTRERLDLLALDKQGNLVIIENKLDDSGRDVTWQALKYASYCSSLSKEDIRNIFQQHLTTCQLEGKAEDLIAEFLEEDNYDEIQLNQGAAQRIVMIAARFRKEVTSTVLWLMNFNIRIQCFKITPYVLHDQLFLNFDQILPVKDAQDYSISMASKAREEIATQEAKRKSDELRFAFWSAFLKKTNQQNDLFSNISPSRVNWITTGIGFTGVTLNMVVSGKYARGEIFFSNNDRETNKENFDFLQEQQAQIEADFGGPLIWERLDNKVRCRIKSQLDGLSLYEEEDWPQMISYMIDAAERMHKAFHGPVQQLNRKVKQRKG